MTNQYSQSGNLSRKEYADKKFELYWLSIQRLDDFLNKFNAEKLCLATQLHLKLEELSFVDRAFRVLRCSKLLNKWSSIYIAQMEQTNLADVYET
jgi:hypothetical protein